MPTPRPIANAASLVAALLLAAGCAQPPAPNEEAVLAPDEDENPVRDADADGVPDATDACPGSRTRLGIDAVGCSALDGPIEGLAFRPGRAELGKAAREALGVVVAALQSAPDAVVAVHAHTDNRGSAVDNLELSKRRVQSVVRYLVTRGIPAERLRPEAFGEARPVAPNATAEGRAANRRIEVRVVSDSASEA